MWKFSDKNVRTLEQPTTDVDPEFVRTETFDLNGPISVDVRSASGDITLVPTQEMTATVRLIARSQQATSRLARAEVHFDQGAGKVTVRTRPKEHGRSGFLDFGRDDLDVEMSLPDGCSVAVYSASGNLQAVGHYNDVRVATASGDAYVDTAGGEFQVDVASGDVRVHHTAGPVSIKTASGDVVVENAHGPTKIHTVSGDVHLAVSGPLETRLNAISGDLTISVVPGLTIDVNASSLSGSLTSEIDLDTNAPASESSGTVVIDAKTISGDVRVKRA